MEGMLQTGRNPRKVPVTFITFATSGREWWLSSHSEPRLVTYNHNHHLLTYYDLHPCLWIDTCQRFSTREMIILRWLVVAPLVLLYSSGLTNWNKGHAAYIGFLQNVTNLDISKNQGHLKPSFSTLSLNHPIQPFFLWLKNTYVYLCNHAILYLYVLYLHII